MTFGIHFLFSQVSDPDEMDVVNMNMVMSKAVPDQPPEDIFDDTPLHIKSEKTVISDLVSRIKLESQQFSEDHDNSSVTDDYENNETEELIISTDNLEGAIDHIKTEIEGAEIKCDVDEDCIDIETVSEQMPGMLMERK